MLQAALWRWAALPSATSRPEATRTGSRWNWWQAGTYTIDLRGNGTGDGTLGDPYLHGIHDGEGNLISGTTSDNEGAGDNSRVIFTAADTGTYYIAAGAYSGQGTYEVAVTDTSLAADGGREDATDLGDITDLARPQFPRGALEGDADAVDWYRFEITEAKAVERRLGSGSRHLRSFADRARCRLCELRSDDPRCRPTHSEKPLSAEAGPFWTLPTQMK